MYRRFISVNFCFLSMYIHCTYSLFQNVVGLFAYTIFFLSLSILLLSVPPRLPSDTTTNYLVADAMNAQKLNKYVLYMYVVQQFFFVLTLSLFPISFLTWSLVYIFFLACACTEITTTIEHNMQCSFFFAPVLLFLDDLYYIFGRS